MPIFEGFANGEHFSIIDVVIAFGFCHRLQTVDDHVTETIKMFLGDHATSRIAGCINFNTGRERQGPDGEDGLQIKGRL